MEIGPLLFFILGIPLLIAAMIGLFILVFKLGVIIYKALEKPEQGESSHYRLDQGREIDER
ncbi:MAG: hypothetical protein JXA37_09675 [Chloroflexia bacterium]|nr:hypothetical protein [Chloroflexia bacterium]